MNNECLQYQPAVLKNKITCKFYYGDIFLDLIQAMLDSEEDPFIILKIIFHWGTSCWGNYDKMFG